MKNSVSSHNVKTGVVTFLGLGGCFLLSKCSFLPGFLYEKLPALLAVILFVFVIYRIFIARPPCPYCRSKDLNLLGIVEDDSKSHDYRVFTCNSCKREFLVDRLSAD